MESVHFTLCREGKNVCRHRDGLLLEDQKGHGGIVSEVRKYQNPWIPARAREILAAEQGRILDVGGGLSPYFRAQHVIDIAPFDAERLMQNAWGAGEKSEI